MVRNPGRFARSWALAKESYAVLKSTPEMALFPIISGVVTLVVMASFAVPLYLTTHGRSESYSKDPLHYVVLFAFYFVTSFVVIFFNSGLVSCAYDRLNGRPTTYKQGLANASRHMGSILVWSLISATVGVILRAIAERSGLIGRIVIALLGAAWSLVTYFVVPIMVVENAGAFKAVKESGSLLKRSWGERIIGGVAISGVTGILMLIGLVPFIGGIAILASTPTLWPVAVVLFALAVMYWIFLSIVSSALTGIFNTAVYIYASTGQVPAGFSSEYVQMAFMQKGATNYFRKPR